MTNEFGMKLDRNGYCKSVVQNDIDHCFLCGRYGTLQRHECIHGSNRTKSKNYGLWVAVCQNCHTKIHAKRSETELDRRLHEIAQECAKKRYGWNNEDFRKRFGKSWLDD